MIFIVGIAIQKVLEQVYLSDWWQIIIVNFHLFIYLFYYLSLMINFSPLL